MVLAEFLVFGFHVFSCVGILIFFSWKFTQFLVMFAISPALIPASPASAMMSLVLMFGAVASSCSYSLGFSWSCLLPIVLL